MKSLMYSLSFIIATTLTLPFQPSFAIDSFYAVQTNDKKVQNRLNTDHEPNRSEAKSFDENECELINGKLECLEISDKAEIEINDNKTLTKSRSLKNKEDF